MAYKAIYRKWRPMVFEDIIGQSHITETLKNQIVEGRIGHAYLFCGTRGTGKTTAAKIFARAVNCESNQNGSPCNHCSICRGISDGSIMDVAEIDAASNNGVDSIRELREDTKYMTASAKYRVYIIDEVHMLSTSAFNALLKTLEEPPEHVIFILATTEPHQVPQTILSRCQRYDFRRIKPAEIIIRLKEIAYGEGFEITEDAYALIARLGDGSMRDAISVLERVVSSCGKKITGEDITSSLGIIPIESEFDVAGALISGDTDKVFECMGEIADSGYDLNVFADSLISHFRNLIVCKVSSSPENLLDYSEEEIARYKSAASKTTFEKLNYIIQCLTDAKSKAKWVKSPRVIYETVFVKITRPELDTSSDALIARLSDMENKIENGKITVEVSRSEEAKEEKINSSPKPKPSVKLFNPIPKDKLNDSNPIVIAAKKWEKTVSSITKRNPFLATALVGTTITIDNDGIILLYDRITEKAGYNIANNKLNMITQLACQLCGIDMCIKVAYKDELEDYIIDFWALPKENPPEEKLQKDPLSMVMDKMEDFIDSVDDREFLTYKPDEDFSQSEFDEEESEEFLEEDEKEQY